MSIKAIDLNATLSRTAAFDSHAPRYLPPEEPIEPADNAARQRLEAEMKRALWAQQASQSWAALTAAKALQPNL